MSTENNSSTNINVCQCDNNTEKKLLDSEGLNMVLLALDKRFDDLKTMIDARFETINAVFERILYLDTESNEDNTGATE